MSSETFLREVHHFLWTEPFVNASGALDHGWNCRDHAWITALLCHSTSHNAVIFHGQSALISGPTNAQSGMCIHQAPHWWVGVENVGSFDLSIKRVTRHEAQELRFPITCLFANKPIPQGRAQAIFIRNVGEFQKAMSSLLHRRNHTALLYLLEGGEHLDEGHIVCAPNWINSPLTDTLRSRFGSPADVYCALFLHLHSFLSGNAKSLSSLTKEEAWAQVSKFREGSMSRTLEVLQSERVLPPAAQQKVAADAPQAARN